MRFAFLLAIMAVIFGVVWGYFLNVIELVTGYAHMAFVEVALRVVGIFVPIIGAFFGWF